MTESNIKPSAVSPIGGSIPLVVLYHKDCMDGTGAKYAAWSVLRDKASYIPVQYGSELPPIPDGAMVWILDFSYPKDVLEKLHQRTSSLTVLDHHKTAQAALKDLPYAKFDMDKSGAVLAWEHFHPGETVPDLLLHVQDRDLWNWKLKNTEAVTKGLALSQGKMDEWLDLTQSDYKFKNLIKAGKTLAKADALKVQSSASKIRLISLRMGDKTFKCGVINSTELGSEIGAMMNTVMGIDVAIIYFFTKEGQLVLSLRSRNGSDVDVSEIATALGGGGHKHAAGARLEPVVITSLISASIEAPVSVEALSCYAIK